jgi:hypothetical protein
MAMSVCGAPAGGSARESKNDRKKRNVPLRRKCLPKPRTLRRTNATDEAGGEIIARRTGWENETARRSRDPAPVGTGRFATPPGLMAVAKLLRPPVRLGSRT